MTDTFTPALLPQKEHCTDLTHNVPYEECGCKKHPVFEEGTFKTQGRIIYTSFPFGEVEIAYKSIKTDEDGYPMVVDNEVYLAALEAYIKKQIFTIKFDTGGISGNIL